MTKKFILTVFLLVFASAALAVPQYINYQGMLRDSSGNTLTGTYTMIFKIYDESSGGSAVYNPSGSTTSVSVSNGLYNVELGPVDSSVFDGNDRWLEITVDGDKLSPRLKINSVAYAIMAASVSDEAITGAKLSSSINIDTTGNISAETYTIKGALNIETGSNAIVGEGQIDALEISDTVINVPVTSSSYIILTVGHAGSVATNSNDNGGIRISAIGTNQFTVSTMNGIGAAANIPYSYLIIN